VLLKDGQLEQAEQYYVAPEEVGVITHQAQLQTIFIQFL